MTNYPVPMDPSPRKGTLLDSVSVREGGIGFTDGAEPFYDSYNCMHFAAGGTDFCDTPAKDFDQSANWQSGFRFGVWGGAQCKSVGLDFDRQVSEVERVFRLNESIAVERAFMDTRFTATTDLDPNGDPRWDAPTDVNAAGAVKPAVGIALLEEYAAANYAGVPILHAPVSIVSLILAVSGAEVDGSVIRTRLGSKLVAGAGYGYPNNGPDGLPAAAGERWLYATGEIAVRRTDLKTPQEMAHSTNDVFVLAERSYVGVVDCFTAAVRVQVTT